MRAGTAKPVMAWGGGDCTARVHELLFVFFFFPSAGHATSTTLPLPHRGSTRERVRGCASVGRQS